MINFGGLGGLGGFPTRSSAPNSQQVMTGDEMGNQFFNKLHGYQQERDQTIAGYDAQRKHFNAAQLDRQNNGLPQMTFAGEGGVVPTIGTFAGEGGIAYSSPNGPTLTPPTPSYSNEIKAAHNLYGSQQRGLEDAHTARMAEFNQNQIRQQQAYDGMIGNGAQHGLMPPNYSDPNFGEVSGIANSGVAEDSTGTFSPNGRFRGVYNPNPFGELQSNSNPFGSFL